MKWKISTFLLIGLTIILCLNLSRSKQEILKLNATSTVIGKTDTVYVTKEFKYVPKYNTQVLPNKILLYGNLNNLNFSRFHDSSGYSNSCLNSDSLDSQNHKEDSLVQLLLSKENLKLSFFSHDTNNFLTREFKLNLEDYKYNWMNGSLSQEKVKWKLKFQPYAYTRYRFFNNLLDLGLGIQLKTQNLQYKLGLNGFYYPSLENKMGTDLEFTFTYNY